MNGARASRYRDFLRHRARRDVLDGAVPKVKAILDGYMTSRRGETTPTTEILWGRIFLATVLVVGLIGGLAALVGPGNLACGVACIGAAGLVLAGLRFAVLRMKGSK